MSKLLVTKDPTRVATVGTEFRLPTNTNAFANKKESGWAGWAATWKREGWEGRDGEKDGSLALLQKGGYIKGQHL